MTDAVIIARRRKWSAPAKAALLAEIEAEGGKVSVVARRHGVSESLLYNWRSARKAAATALGVAGGVEFVSLGVIGGATGATSAMLAAPQPQARHYGDAAGGIEIALPNGARVRVDARVNERALARVLRAMKAVL